MIILIMGLSGSGKTTLAQSMVSKLPDATWLNADTLRTIYMDWDFSYAGRVRQAERMHRLSRNLESSYVICDFIAPLQELRDIFKADYTIFLDTVDASIYENTDKMFERPSKVDFVCYSKNADYNSSLIIEQLGNKLP
jgi:adenylylsulfate kinase-like enzyme